MPAERKPIAPTVHKLNRLSESSGELRWGSGLITGVIALSLAILCFLGVLAFHFPAYLTTPELRRMWEEELAGMRQFDRPELVPVWLDIGHRAAERQIRQEHFVASFDRTPTALSA